jgi:hypothetical protein
MRLLIQQSSANLAFVVRSKRNSQLGQPTSCSACCGRENVGGRRVFQQQPPLKNFPVGCQTRRYGAALARISHSAHRKRLPLVA